ncbi:YciI family protein [Hyphococcus flavus]|uniref:YciI family protein n=1 Tax=Hyphococcus flavus TaxID=1866326 RepID=A0AAF0CFL0_9PROT|nr:YciI family protein [Hyphococcus flavus]WDI31078.1 YciI family protein [Hyphococcus flavus]
MKYLFLLYDDENVWDEMPEDKRNEIFGSYMAYSEALKKSGAFIGGEPLVHSREAKRVRQTQVQDGPFADGKEQLGGYYMIDAKNLDEALDWAARCPCAELGHVEVRPVWNIEG